MEWLNYHHLHYFWVAAREGSIAGACSELRLAQPTISAQIKTLEEALGEKLFLRSGRGLVLSETGRIVYDYAEKIFSLGDELKQTVRDGAKRQVLVVGIADVLPKLVAYRLLQPIRPLHGPVSFDCREGRPEELCAELALHKLDVVLTDTPMTETVRIKAYNHLLGESGISFFASEKLSMRYKKNFPASLNHAPMLLPSDDSSVRGALDRWFETLRIKPLIVGEFADTALMMIFGEEGEGIFPVPTIVAKDVKKKAALSVVGKTRDVIEKFYAISIEKRLKHPAVLAISEMARETLFK